MCAKHSTNKKSLQICPFCKQHFTRLQTHLSQMGPCRNSLTKGKRTHNRRVSVKGSCNSGEITNLTHSINEKLSNVFSEQTEENDSAKSTNIDDISNYLSDLDIHKLTCELHQGNHRHTLSYKHVVSLQLFQMLNKVRAPISLYNDIGKFILQNISHIKRCNGSVVIPRDKMIKDMDNFICMKKNKKKRKGDNTVLQTGWKYDLKPFQFEVQLMRSSYVISVPHFDFVSAYMNIMNDPSLTTDVSNLLYNDKNYLFPQCQDSNIIDDIHTGQWYKDTHKNMINNVNKEILCPIILFIDGVSIDSIGRMSLEPISFTLGWLSKKRRNMKGSWRVLGYIPDIEKTLKIDYKSEYGNDRNVKKKIIIIKL